MTLVSIEALKESLSGGAYSTVPGPEAGDALLGVLPAVSGHYGFEDVLGSVPELVVLIFEEDDHARGLGVERGGDILATQMLGSLDLLRGHWAP